MSPAGSPCSFLAKTVTTAHHLADGGQNDTAQPLRRRQMVRFGVRERRRGPQAPERRPFELNFEALACSRRCRLRRI